MMSASIVSGYLVVFVAYTRKGSVHKLDIPSWEDLYVRCYLTQLHITHG